MDELLELKKIMKESDKGKCIDKRNQYFENWFVYDKDVMAKIENDRNID